MTAFIPQINLWVFCLNFYKTKDVATEIDKFKEIASQVNKGDFELKKCADELRKGDKEKLELMRKIDNLERLVSKMRQRR